MRVRSKHNIIMKSILRCIRFTLLMLLSFCKAVEKLAAYNVGCLVTTDANGKEYLYSPENDSSSSSSSSRNRLNSF